MVGLVAADQRSATASCTAGSSFRVSRRIRPSSSRSRGRAGQPVPQLDQLADRGHHGGAECAAQQSDVQGDPGDGGGRLGDGGRVDRGHGPAAHGLAETFVQRACGGFEMGLRGADGSLPVDRRGEGRADAGEGRGGEAVGEQGPVGQEGDPPFPVRAAHHRHGLLDVVTLGRPGGDLLDLRGAVLVEDGGLGGVRRADRLEDRGVHAAGVLPALPVPRPVSPAPRPGTRSRTPRGTGP